MKKNILLIGTGGTIACGETPGGLAPSFSARELMDFVPEIEDMCSVECVQPFNIDSAGISTSHWRSIVDVVRESYDRFDGFVITHGTDTMSYTAAALSYFIQNSKKPIILTGSQKPIGYDGSDVKTNLRDSFICACSDELCGVLVVFDGDVISGTRLRKTDSQSLSAFESINFPCIASVSGGRLTRYIDMKLSGRPCFCEQPCPDIGMMRMFPTVKRSQLENMLSSCRGIVIESYGAGGFPVDRFKEQLERAFSNGAVIVMTVQAENGGSNLSSYSDGRRLRSYPRVFEGYDITTEAAVTKLMWALSCSDDIEKVRRMFYTPVQYDIFPPDCNI